MKKIFFILFLLSIVNFQKINAQQIVSDLGSYVYFADMVSDGLEQFEKVSKTLEFTKKTYKIYEEANEYLTQVKYIKNMLSDFQDISEIVNRIPKKISQVKNAKIRVELYEKFYRAFKKSEVLADVINVSLKGGDKEGIRGTDTERLKFLMKASDKVYKVRTQLESIESEIYFL